MIFFLAATRESIDIESNIQGSIWRLDRMLPWLK
jgi:hypothetical protein